MRTSSLALLLAMTTLGSAACGGTLEGEPEAADQSSALGIDKQPLGHGPKVPVGLLPASLYGTITSYAGFPGHNDHSDGPVQTSFCHPRWVAATPNGATWVIDADDAAPQAGSYSKHRIRLIQDTRGAAVGAKHLTTLPDLMGYGINLAEVTGVAADQLSGELFFTLPSVIWRIGEAGVPSSVAWRKPFSGLGGIVRDAQGNLFVAESSTHAIKKIDASNTVTIVAQDLDPSSTFAPGALAMDPRDGSLFTVSGNAVYHVVPGPTPGSGSIALHAGDAAVAGNQNGLGLAARFNGPRGLAVDRSGSVYVADTGNALIRKIVVPVGGAAAPVETVAFHVYSNQATFDGYGPDDDVTLIEPQGLSFWGDALVMSDNMRGNVRILH